MRIVLAGASGFLGTRLADRLSAEGHDLLRLVRRPAAGPGEGRWDPHNGELDPAHLAGADAVINLAGAGVGDKRWTAAYKREIRSSRIDTAGTLATVIAQLPRDRRPRAFLQQTGVAWYGDTGDRAVTEDAPAGSGFLTDTVRLWEAATNPAEDAGTRVVLLRTAPVVDRESPFLKAQLLPFRLGLGGRLGNGRQWAPWIALPDWLDAVMFLLEREDISGPVNVVASPVTNTHFTAALAAAVHRPAVLRVPGVALRVLYGGFAEEALRSQRVVPGVLSRAGFRFRYPDIEEALRAAISGWAPAAR